MIRLQDLHKHYGTKGKQAAALQGIDLTVRQGEIFGIIGHSGAGKSTLLRCVNLLERPTGGTVTVGGAELTKLGGRELQAQRRKIGMIFQHFNLLTSATAADNIAFPLKLAKTPKADIGRRVDELLALVGLKDHRDKYPAQLSGGQKQRVGIARALANGPDVLLCDEATSALDPQTTQSILALLLDINRKLGLTILLITHEMNVIRSICDRVAVLDGGRIVETGAVARVFLHPQHPTTREFVSQVSDAALVWADAPAAGDTSAAVPAHTTQDSGRVRLRVTFLGSQTYEPVLYEAVKSTGASLAILQGTISRMKDTPYGQLVVELRGSDRDTQAVVEALRVNGLEVDVL